MRYIILFLISMLVLCNAPATAQRRSVGIFKFGVDASFINPDFSSSNTARFGIVVGIAPTIPLSKQLYLKPELSYSMKGGVVNYQQPFFSGSVKYRLNYFELPVLLGIRVSKHVAFEAGPYAALRTSGNFDFKGTFLNGYGTFSADDLNNFDYGITGGVVLTGRFALVGIRYYQGLQMINNNPGLDAFLGHATNHTIQIYFQRSTNQERRKRHHNV